MNTTEPTTSRNWFYDLLAQLFKREKTARSSREGVTPIGPPHDELLSQSKLEQLTVVVSGPLSNLAGERDIIAEYLDWLPTARPERFEAKGRTGRAPDDASLEIIRAADVVIVLIGASSGSTSSRDGKSYSELEFEEIRNLQKVRNGRPRVLIYKPKPHSIDQGERPGAEGGSETRRPTPITRSLALWEQEAIRDYGCMEYSSHEELALMCLTDVASALLLERRDQAKALFKKHAIEEAARDEQRAQHERLIHHKDSEITALGASLESARKLHNDQFDEIERGRDALRREQEYLSSRLETFGAAWRRSAILAAAWTLVVAVVTMATVDLLEVDNGNLEEKTLRLQSEDLRSAAAAIDRVAAAVADRNDFTASKVAIARALNPDFDCALRDQAEWPVRNVESATFMRRDVCYGHGGVLIALESSGDPCEVEIADPKAIHDLVELVGKAGVAVPLVRVVAHASTEPVNAACPPPPAQWQQCLDDDMLTLDSNAKLARARSVVAACAIRDAFSKSAQSVAMPRIEPHGWSSVRSQLSQAVDHAPDRSVRIEILTASPLN
jgi:hypothetical protein